MMVGVGKSWGWGAFHLEPVEYEMPGTARRRCQGGISKELDLRRDANLGVLIDRCNLEPGNGVTRGPECRVKKERGFWEGVPAVWQYPPKHRAP